MKGPLLLATEIGLVVILVSSAMLFSISSPLNKSKNPLAYSSWPTERPPIPIPEPILVLLYVNNFRNFMTPPPP